MEGVLLSELLFVGGNIEGCLAAKYAKQWASTCTVLDVPVRYGSTTNRLDGTVLRDFAEISAVHAKSPDFENTLKESIIKEFDMDVFFEQQVAVIDYYRSHSESFHVHIHRGAGMGKKHIRVLEGKLKGDVDGITFGFGYEHDQLDPHIENLDVYYGVSLIVGTGHGVTCGDTFLPTSFTPLRNDTLHPLERVTAKNILTDGAVKIPKLAGSNVSIFTLDGIYNPTPETRIKIIR